MSEYELEEKKIGAVVDLLLNGGERGPHAFVLIVCPDLIEQIGEAPMANVLTRVLANVDYPMVAKILNATMLQTENDNDNNEEEIH